MIVLAPALIAGPEWAVAGSRGERYVEAPVFPVEARGCYYRRGREYCGRYCYVELNGKRYCQERRRDAVPQASYDMWAPEPGRFK